MAPGGLIGRLFGRKKQAETPPLTLAGAYAQAFAHGLDGVRGQGPSSTVTATPVEPGNVRGHLAAVRDGIAVYYHTDSDRPRLTLVYPEKWVRSKVGWEPETALRAALLKLEDAPSRLAGLGPTDGSAAAPLESAPVLRVSTRIREVDAAALAWCALDQRVWLLRTPEAGPIVLAPSDFAERIESELAGSPAFQQAVRSLIAPASPSATASPARIALTLPAELLACRFFLPQRVACGNHTIQARTRALALGNAHGTGAGPADVWITARCMLGKQVWRVSYRFRVESAERAASLAGTLKQLAACVHREILARLSAQPGLKPDRPQVAPGGEPESARRGSYLVLDAILTVSGLRVPCEVWVPGSSVAALCAALTDPWDWAQAQLERPAILSAMLSLNRALLRTDVAHLDRELLQARGARQEAHPVFPFAAFVEMASDRDVRLALQNHVVPSLGGGSLRALFAYTETVRGTDGKPKTRVVTPLAVEEERLMNFLPRSAADGWKEGASDLRGREGYLALNRETLRGIRDAARSRRLLLSDHAKAILDTMFYATIHAEARKVLDEVLAARLPFSEIEKLDRPRIQELLGRAGTRDLGLALIGADAEWPMVRANTSRAKSEELHRDLVDLKRQVDQGAIDLEDVIQAKRSLADQAVHTREADRERARREREKGAKRAGVPVASSRPVRAPPVRRPQDR